LLFCVQLSATDSKTEFTTTKAYLHIEQAFSAVSCESHPQLWGYVAYSLGMFIGNNPGGDTKRAITLIEQSLEPQFHRNPDSRSCVLAWQTLGSLYDEIKTDVHDDNASKAIFYYRKSLPELSTKQTDYPKSFVAFAKLLTDRGFESLKLNIIEKAIEDFEELLSIGSSAPILSGPISTIANIGLAQMFYKRTNGDQVTNLKKSVKLFQKAFPALEAIDSHPNLAEYYITFGNSHEGLAKLGVDRAINVAEAIKCYKHALSLLDPESDRWVQLSAELAVVELTMQQRDY
jgi:tetratricopeptide (TPR) repeat protein